MQNESCPRRARRRKAHRRGSQQTGRIGRAKRKRRRSFCGLQLSGPEHVRALNMAGNTEGFFELKNMLWRNCLPLRHRLRGYPNRTRNRASAACGTFYCD